MSCDLLIIDGHNFLFRSYYGVPSHISFSDGTQINAVYGFFSLLRSAVSELDPDHLIIIFDSETALDEKKEAMPGYKVNRIAPDEEIFEQLAIIKGCLDLMGIYWHEDALNEADDVIGSFAAWYSAQRKKAYICSNDKDFLQLVAEGVCVVRGLRGANVVLDESSVSKEYGLDARFFIDFMALVGDKSDNIPGVKGIGAKYATQMISEFGSIEEIYNSVDSLPTLLRKRMLGEEQALLERRDFLKINTKLPVPPSFDLDQAVLPPNGVPGSMGKFLLCHWRELT